MNKVTWGLSPVEKRKKKRLQVNQDTCWNIGWNTVIPINLSWFLFLSLSVFFFCLSVSGIKATLLRLSSRSFDPSLSGPQGPQTALLSAQLLEPFTEEDNNAINYNAQQIKREREREKEIYKGIKCSNNSAILTESHCYDLVQYIHSFIL